MELNLERFGQLYELRLTDPIPSQLDGYPWPSDIAQAISASDDAYVRVTEAHSAWEDSVAALDAATSADDAALRAALRAGKPDPGTPATELAKRAEHVQWTAFALVREECERLLLAGKSAVSTYLQTHAGELARAELDRLAEYRAAHVKLTAAQAEDAAALEQVGNATRTMNSYVSARWGDSDDVALRWQADDRRWQNYGLANDQLEAKWKSLAATGAEPPPTAIADQTADQLATDAAYGNTEARAELKRRRVASRTATV